MILYLHVFHPEQDWDCRNLAVVSDSPDMPDWEEQIRKEWGSTSRDGFAPYRRPLLHDIYPIEPGMKIEAQGYDWATIQINGKEPEQKNLSGR